MWILWLLLAVALAPWAFKVCLSGARSLKAEWLGDTARPGTCSCSDDDGFPWKYKVVSNGHYYRVVRVGNRGGRKYLVYHKNHEDHYFFDWERKLENATVWENGDKAEAARAYVEDQQWKQWYRTHGNWQEV